MADKKYKFLVFYIGENGQGTFPLWTEVTLEKPLTDAKDLQEIEEAIQNANGYKKVCTTNIIPLPIVHPDYDK